MRICEIEGWPPTLTDSYSSQQTLPASAPAKLKRCRMFSVAGSSTPYLSIIVEFQDRDWHAMIVDQPESLLTRIEATLRGHEGEALANLGDLEIIEIP